MEKSFYLPDNTEQIEEILEGLVESCQGNGLLILYAFALGAKAKELEQGSDE